MTVRLGIIGLSEGNGHPYSWSAIINGYSAPHMADCGFPGIPRYLAEQTWPDARLPGAQVTHIWTESPDLSRKIAQASLIPHVVDEVRQMLGQVDAILLARDDAENHFEYARPFLEAGLPIYIDKPIALSKEGLNRLYELEQYEGQIFSCSALRYAQELKLDDTTREAIGSVRHLQAVTPRSWAKYAVHIIEPCLNLLAGQPALLSQYAAPVGTAGSSVLCHFDGDISCHFAALGYETSSPIAIRVHGEHGWQDLIFRDSFSAFKAALADFIEGIVKKECRSPRAFNEHVVRIIECGMSSRP